MHKFSQILLFLVLLTPACLSPSQDISIEKMKCEYLLNPLGIDAESPKLSWQIKNKGVRGEKQTAYRILVASSTDNLMNGKADLWDSGKVETGQSQHVEYKGKPLHSRMHAIGK